ncbi:hypothetical protein [Gimesia alba]|uniref:hypothetical protein n=1 Tax=Gimesia alba TaxID=2527973 RepID=UPI0011A53B44|nr:hypothetical protein [Gimesia alba]
MSTRSPSSEGEDSSLKSADEVIDLIESSTNEETEKLPPPIPFDPPLTAMEINGILQQCLEQILTSADFKRQREFYGTPGSKDVQLVNSSKTPWPANFHPKVKGYDLRFAKSNSVDLDGNRILGIRLDKLDVVAPNAGLFDGNIVLALSNVGGTKNGAVNGGCFLNFTVHRQGDNYVAAFSSSFDP